MPELPEVETIAQGLRLGGQGIPSLVGMKIERAHLLWERTLATPAPAEFMKRIAGQVIHAIGRRGKFLLFQLSPDTLLIHLRMSGDLIVEPAAAAVQPHHRLMLDFDNGLRLVFNDARKFGRVWLTADPQEVTAKLGPEPFDLELTAEKLHERLLTRRRLLKPLLLDQTFLAGLGNIYTDEALFLSRLHPNTPSDRLTLPHTEILLANIRQVLLEGIRHHGASIDWVYRGGDFQNYFRVYGRKGLPCPVCGTPVERILVGQRGTHFCAHCQKEEMEK